MSCCDPTILSFASVATLSIAYTAAMITQYGLAPSVEVFLQNDDGLFQNENGMPGVSIHFNGATINIDFGGPGSGIVKIT